MAKKRRAQAHTAVSADIPALLSYYVLSQDLGKVKCAREPCFVHIACVHHPHLNRNIERGLADKWRDRTDRYDPWVVGDEIAGRDVTSLVLIAPDVKSELHRALRTELITCAVLGQTQVKTFTPHLSQQEINGASHQIWHPPPSKQAPKTFYLTHSGILHLIHNVIAGEWDETCGKKKIGGMSERDHGSTSAPTEMGSAPSLD